MNVGIFGASPRNFRNKPQFKNPGAGNHFYLQHGDHVVLYAHMQKGSLNPALLAAGATVKRGDVLGLAGNAGNSTGPHLHFHAIKGTDVKTIKTIRINRLASSSQLVGMTFSSAKK